MSLGHYSLMQAYEQALTIKKRYHGKYEVLFSPIYSKGIVSLGTKTIAALHCCLDEYLVDGSINLDGRILTGTIKNLMIPIFHQ